jgi:16S rRNA (uracil1498-N3)-methyltransferase
MTTPTIFTEIHCETGELVVLTGSAHHYLVRVLRIRPGETVKLSDRMGQTARCEVQATSDRDLSLRVQELLDAPTDPPTPIVLVASPLKGKGTRRLVGACAELGIERLLLTRMEYSTYAATPAKMARFERVAEEAARKVGQTRLTTLELVPTLADCLDRYAHLPRYFFWEKNGNDPRTLDLQGAPGVLCFVGPEGGFSDQEVSLLIERGATPICFQGPAYTVPTATLMGLTVLMLAAGRL